MCKLSMMNTPRPGFRFQHFKCFRTFSIDREAITPLDSDAAGMIQASFHFHNTRTIMRSQPLSSKLSSLGSCVNLLVNRQRA